MELNLLLSFFRTESGTRGCRTGATTGSNPVTLCSATSRRAPSASRSVADCWDQPEASPSPSSASSSQSFPKLFFSLLFRLWISFQYLSLVSPLLLSFAPLLLMLPPSGDDIAKLFWPQKIRYCQKFAAWLGNAPYPWSSLVQGDEGCIVKCCVCDKPKIIDAGHAWQLSIHVWLLGQYLKSSMTYLMKFCKSCHPRATDKKVLQLSVLDPISN